MDIDLTKLDSIVNTSPQKADTDTLGHKPIQLTREQLKGLETQNTGTQGQRAEEAPKEAGNIDAYRQYLQNMDKSRKLQKEIIDGLKNGERLPVMLLKACDAICLMTDNNKFYVKVNDLLQGLYGNAFTEELPKEWELEETKNRMIQIEEALEKNPDPKTRATLEEALEAHKFRANEIRILLRKDGAMPFI